MTTHQQPPAHQAVIAAALWDWWTTTDPVQPFDPADPAENVERYLISSGYTITPDTPGPHPMPTRRAIVTVTALALICAASATGAACRGDWAWAALGALGTALLTREAIRDIRHRRNGRTAR